MAYRQDLFSATVAQLRGGRTQEELSKKLNELVNACRDTGKSGTISLKITIKPDKGDTGQYFLEDNTTVKLPEFERGKTLMFGTPDGNLQRTDPNQGELPLRQVNDDRQPAKQVAQPAETTKTVNQ